MTGEQIAEVRARCEAMRDQLRELARIHLEIDGPTRPIGTDDPEWILRLRKVCLHAVAVSRWEVSIDNVHVMATELRAAFVQMEAVWDFVPDEFRLPKMDGGWWADEARSGLLATYDHPTPLSLAFSLAVGGFGDAENPRTYVQLAVWLGRLGLGYGLTLPFLGQVLGTERDINARLAAVLRDGAADPS